MDNILEGFQNTACIIDDVCISSDDTQSHEQYLFPVLQKLQDSGVTLNIDKCEFMQPQITFVGHKITAAGISADDRKVAAIKNMPVPTCVTELRRFLGLVNQLGKFSSKLAETTVGLKPLLKKDNAWIWGQVQQKSFKDTVDEICSPRVLAQYNPAFDTKIRTDASKHGYGAVLLQREPSSQDYRPIYFASKSLTPAETRYSVIEKEAGAIAWACKKFDQFILGMYNLKIESDQKPLVTLLGKKSLDDLPPRIVRFKLSLVRYKFSYHSCPWEIHV